MFCKNIDVLWIFFINELFFLLKKFCFSSFNNSLLIPFFGIPPPFYRLFCMPYVTGFREILSPKGGGETILKVYIWDLYSKLEHITEYLQFFMLRCNNCFRSTKMLYLLSQNIITILIIYNSVINLSVQRYGKFTFTYQYTAKTVYRCRK